MKEYFDIEKEIACKCGCGFKTPNPITLNAVTDARIIAGIPFIVRSWCRCEKHNKAQGGKENSAHLTGEAVDIAFKNSNECFVIIRALLDAGFVRLGINFDKGFIHCDTAKSDKHPQCVLFKY